MTKKGPQNQHLASRTHGMDAFYRRGEASLIDPTQVGNLQELRELVRSQPGRDALREEMTARLAMICYMGFSELQKQADAGKPIFKTDVLKRLATYSAELRRMLASFPVEPDAIDITDYLKGDHGQEQGD